MVAGQLLGVAADTVYNDQEHEFTVAHAYLYPRRHGRKQLVPYCIAHGLTFLFIFIYNLMIGFLINFAEIESVTTNLTVSERRSLHTLHKLYSICWSRLGYS